MAEGKICVCPQCGKKFKLKADFASASFACTACGATVWVEGKPQTSSAPRSKRAGPTRTGGGKRGTRRAGGGRAAAKAAPAARGQRRGRAAPPEDEEQRGRGRYQQPKNNSQNVIIAVMGLVIVVGAIAFFMMGKDDQADTSGNTAAAGANAGDGIADEGGNGSTDAGGDGGAADGGAGDGATPVASNASDASGQDGGDEGADERTDEGTEAGSAGEGSTPLKKAPSEVRIEERDGKKVKVRISRWNPPEDMGHLESTPAELRTQIDELIKVMFDPFAGSDCFDAKQKLAQIGKPAYLPILAAMVKAKETFKWDNAHDDNVNMASVKLADECLRLMDGYLEANGIGVIRPGTDEKYYGYVIRMHYKRWKQTLEGLDKMPGPFDPSTEYEKETETVEDD